MTIFSGNYGIKDVSSASYHPSTNSQAEQTVQIIRDGFEELSSESLTLQMKLKNFEQFSTESCLIFQQFKDPQLYFSGFV